MKQAIRALGVALTMTAIGAVSAQAQKEPGLTAMVQEPCADAQDRPMDTTLLPALKPGAAPFKLPPEQLADVIKIMQEQRARDWANLCRYRAANAALKRSPRVVFMGDSITEAWAIADPALFEKDFVSLGISGQTSPQMLVRFRADVIELRPQLVHIMTGTNDLAGNTGPTSVEAFMANVKSMAELAKAHNIRVALASIPPAATFSWKPEYAPAEQVRRLNAWLRTYAKENGFLYINYYDVLAAPDGSFRPDLSNDGVHPNFAGYDQMRRVALDTLTNR
jgi:lysophospholipase L1-like esterase